MKFINNIYFTYIRSYSIWGIVFRFLTLIIVSVLLWNYLYNIGFLWLLVLKWIFLFLTLPYDIEMSNQFYEDVFNKSKPRKKNYSYLWASFILSAYPLFNFLFSFFFYTIFGILFYKLNNQYHLSDDVGFLIYPIIVISCFFIVKYGFVLPIFIILKGIANQNQRITIFRKFSKQKVLTSFVSTLGCYGRIQLLTDDNIRVSSKNISKSALSILLEENIFLDLSDIKLSTLKKRDIFTLMSNGFKKKINGKYILDENAIWALIENKEAWKFFAKKYIEKSDLVVFVLQDLPSENVLWELKKTVELKKENEILIIVDTNSISINSQNKIRTILSGIISLNENNYLLSSKNNIDTTMSIANLMLTKMKTIKNNQP